MNYKETIDYLFQQLPMFSRIGVAAFKKDLSNIIELCSVLDNPHKKFRTIHVAGTNGKGSVSHMLAAILQTAGYKTGLYTSPHLNDFRERIKVNGEMVNEDFVITFTANIQSHIKRIHPSFFEITVAMAFDYFAKQEVDVAVVEVGLGGRLDSTNIITPELSIITNIGWDHMNLLGNSLEKIAFEKAGIIKKNIPVVIGETIPETAPVFTQKANEESAPVRIAANEYTIIGCKPLNGYLSVDLESAENKQHLTYLLDLPGIYQTKNLCTVLTAVDVLKENGWQISNTHIMHGLKHSRQINNLRGRWELIQEHPAVVLDVAHNEDGIKQVMQQLTQLSYRQLHIVIGMVKDKEIDKVLAQLPPEAIYYFTKAQIPRALPEEALKAKAAAMHLKGEAYAEVNIALDAAKNASAENDLILVCGSVFLVGEVARI